MVAVTSHAHSRPEARSFRVEDLLRHAQAGRIRVPVFQRAFKWDRDDVRKLIDSIWLGYPIGTLLLWSKKGSAGRVSLGDLTFEVNEQSDAWFVVDGQQRIVSLVSTLLPKARPDKFDLYFDLIGNKITHARRGGLPPTLLPLNRVVDSEDLLAWLDENRLGLTQEQTRLALRVGKIVREYELPAYVVDIDDEHVVREMFERTNSTGKSLEVSDVFNALHAPLDRQPAVSLKDVVERLRVRSLGDIEEDHVLRSLLAIEGKDRSGDLQRQLAEVDIPAAVARTERAMERVFGFLAQDAGIPHLRLLPYKSPLTVLSAFFDRFPTPSERARRLLSRWLWRGTATEELRGDGKGMRPALEAVRLAADDEVAAHEILATVSATRPPATTGEPFNLRYAHARVLAIALVELGPRDLRTGDPLDIPALLGSADDVFPQIVTHKPASTPPEKASVFSSVGNRSLHPTVKDVSMLALFQAGLAPSVLASHGISEAAIHMLGNGDRIGFLETRRDEVEKGAARLVANHAEWGHSDRPSIATLIEQED
jgi:hypothetical protein